MDAYVECDSLFSKYQHAACRLFQHPIKKELCIYLSVMKMLTGRVLSGL